MPYDLHDTIAAIGTATGGAARGMVRLSGPQLVDCLRDCFVPTNSDFRFEAVPAATAIPGTIRLGAQQALPCELFFWPTQRSYTRQPTAEIHTLGSPPLLDALLQSVCDFGARLAEPGEFTLRAFLAGRVDLTQAEAVLGVIDASTQQEFNIALTQLAGGLAGPLQSLREELLQLLAELEAGLDFVEEDIEFISNEQLGSKLKSAQETVAAILVQVVQRKSELGVPRAVLVGSPNAGKSSLFNGLVRSSSTKRNALPALVSDQSGTTRDYVTALVNFDGQDCELVDTAGTDDSAALTTLEKAAQTAAAEQSRRAELKLHCVAVDEAGNLPALNDSESDTDIQVITKSDLLETVPVDGEVALACSSYTGEGIVALASEIGQRLANSVPSERCTVTSTAARCTESLTSARSSLAEAVELSAHAGGDELIAAEVRGALVELGRVVGAVSTDDVLDRIFSQFCIGK